MYSSGLLAADSMLL